MNDVTLSSFSAAYLAAFHDFLKSPSPGDLQAARDLGLEARTQGMEPAALGRLHEMSLATLVLPEYAAADEDALTAAAVRFYAAALVMMETKPPVDQRLSEVNAAIVESRLEAVQLSEEQCGLLLTKARLLAEHLHAVEVKILSASLLERVTLSLTLKEELPQTLLDTSLTLMALQQETTRCDLAMSSEITDLQCRLQVSVGIITRFAQEYGLLHEHSAL